MSTTYKLTGNTVIRLAERENLTIRCYANPINDGGVVTLGEAIGIVRDDPSLIYANVTPTGWRDASGNHCDGEGRTVEAYFNSYTGKYLGPDDDGVEPCWNDASGHTVTAPGQVSAERFVSDRGMAVATGAWQTTRVARRVWITEFAGTHQRVPFRVVGRTAGRSLRAMRRKLAFELIPAL